MSFTQIKTCLDILEQNPTIKNYIMHYKGDRIARRNKTLSKLKGTNV